MVLFHGTPKSRGDIIVKEKKISCHAGLMYGDSCVELLESAEFSDNLIKPKTLATTPGFVYLTESVNNSIYYGNKHAVSLKEEFFYIFKVEISEELLEPDKDEIMMVLHENPDNYSSARESLRACHSVRYNQDILSFDYCILPTTLNYKDPRRSLVMDLVCQRPKGREPFVNANSLNQIKEFDSMIKWSKI